MPKKHKNHAFAKPASTAHHTLVSSGPRRDHHGQLRSSHASSSSAEQPSVNQLIDHLRRTQVSKFSENGPESPFTFVAPRSVHPSLRNLLELPETPPPRPRPGARRLGVGSRRLRRTAGPPPPESWLLGSSNTDDVDDYDADLAAAEKERVIYRLERLPGTTLPPRGSLMDTVLRSMATYWEWHLEYDGPFLTDLPNHVKVRLLSYMGIYAKDQPLGGLMRGLRPLFEKPRAIDGPEILHGSDSEITRLDLSSSLGRWLSLKQVSAELLVTEKPNPVQRKAKEPVPSSWEGAYNEEIDSTAGGSTLPSTPSQTLRFENLRYLSLAHPKPGSVNWNSLISLLSRLSTITHLSLAHWPIPTVTPNAINARIRHPNHRSLTFSYGGTDSYSASENNWAEAASLLRRLSRVTYCLKWLDLEGCGDWIPALKWEGTGPAGETYVSGPEWNSSWRDIEWIRLGPGWLPHIDDSEIIPPPRPSTDSTPSGSSSSSLFSPIRSLAFSVHAPHPSLANTTNPRTAASAEQDSPDLPWDVEIERIKYRREKELERFRETVQAAKAVQQWVLRTRKEEKGKWIQFSFGLDGIDESGLKKLFGKEWLGYLP